MFDAPSETPVFRPAHASWKRLWFQTALLGLGIVFAYFLAWEASERALGELAQRDLRLLHLVRGMGAAFLLGTWSFVCIRRARVESEEMLHGYMGLLERRVQERTRELEDARAFTELLFDSLHERIIVRDQRGEVVKANRVAQASGAGRIWEVERISMTPKSARDRFEIEVGRDVTDAKNLEAQVRHQEKMASLGVLTAGFAHDLGNPLASLSTELELLEGEDDVGAFREALGVLRRHVTRMSRTLREMVDFARRRRDEVTSVSIAAAVEDSARLVCRDARWSRVALVVDVPPDVPHVWMVEDHLVLVLVNLMLNAADAMPDGGTLRVTARGDGDTALLSVSDTGYGMTEDVRARAKAPLFTTKGMRGTGLGLAVCDRTVRAIGGTLDVESAPGKGTDVRIRLPVREAGDG
ncbi:MAG: ATP-binding protein [Labilithrix sp.]